MVKKLCSTILISLISISFLSSCGTKACEHDIVIDPAVSATCTDNGKTEGSHCSKCGEIIKKQEEIHSLGHEYVIDEHKDATCTEDGHTSGVYCSRCGEILVKPEVIEHKGHSIVVDEAVDPTCETEGLTEGSHCSTCGEILIQQTIIPKLGHSFVSTKPIYPTPDQKGHTSKTYCERCGLVVEEEHEIDKCSISFDDETEYEIDTKQNIKLYQQGKEFNGSYISKYNEGFITLSHLGSFANISSLKEIKKISIEAEGDIENLFLYTGNCPLPYQNKIQINSQSFFILLENVHYFIISYSGDLNVYVKKIKIEYNYLSEELETNKLSQICIETELDEEGKHKPINSLYDYTTSKIILIDETGKETLNNVNAGVRLRGNSTSAKPKKPYRIKFDKKQSLFGLEKNKNWVLLAEYMDGSNLHNFITQKMVSTFDGFKFAYNMKHVEVFLNGVNQGLYILCEHTDEKKGRMDLEQEIKIDTPLTDINFMLELDARLKTPSDPSEIENITYFKVLVNTTYYYYSVKYPEIDSFPDYDKKTGTSEKYSAFIQHLKTLISSCWSAVISLDYSSIEQLFDLNTLSQFGIIDLFTNELDHAGYSFKFYRENGSKVKFGPCWDYDTVAYGFKMKGNIYTDPFKEHYEITDTLAQSWLKILLKDNYRTSFLDQMRTFSQDNKENIIQCLQNEYALISNLLINDFRLWHDSNISSQFENVRYLNEYLKQRFDHFINIDFATAHQRNDG